MPTRLAPHLTVSGQERSSWEALWGLHMALTQGLFSKLVADTAPGDLRGTASGVFVSGVSDRAPDEMHI